MIYPIILCGGSGTGLWPLPGNKSRLQLTLKRAAQVNGRVAAPPIKA
ncbi:MAG: hypothetical protein ACYCZ6_12735 [Polaromonas sp.]